MSELLAVAPSGGFTDVMVDSGAGKSERIRELARMAKVSWRAEPGAASIARATVRVRSAD